MYAAKVRVGLGKVDDGMPGWGNIPVDTEEASDPTPDTIEFTAGNPRVEHTTGVVHLFKQIPQQTPTDVTPALPVRVSSSSECKRK